MPISSGSPITFLWQNTPYQWRTAKDVHYQTEDKPARPRNPRCCALSLQKLKLARPISYAGHNESNRGHLLRDALSQGVAASVSCLSAPFGIRRRNCAVPAQETLQWFRLGAVIDGSNRQTALAGIHSSVGIGAVLEQPFGDLKMISAASLVECASVRSAVFGRIWVSASFEQKADDVQMGN